MPKGDDKINWMEPPKVAEDLPGWARPGRPDLEIPKPELAQDDLSAIHEASRRAKELDHTEAVARGAALKAVNGILDQQRRDAASAQDEERRKLSPFFAYMDSLRDLSGEDQEEARTEVKLQLFRLEDTGGPKPRKIYCQELTLDQAEVKTMGDPAFERRTQDYAERAGRFGRYEWRMKGWALGELTLDTSVSVHVEAPPGYVPPPNLIPEEKPKADPMEGFSGTLDLVGRVAAMFGAKNGGNLDPVELKKLEAMSYEQGQRAGKMEGRYEAEREHRKELDDLRERHRRELDDAERKGLDRGKVDGAREVRDELTPKLWQLEHANGLPESSLVSDLVVNLGGPEAFQGLVGAVVTNLNKPKPNPAPATRRMAPAGNPPIPLVPGPKVALNPSQSEEPSRADYLEAMNLVEEAVAIIEEAIPNEPPENAEKLGQLKPLLEAFHGEGMKEGPLVAWWADWNQRWKPIAEAILNAAEEHQAGQDAEPQPEPALGPEPEPEEEPVNLEALRALLIEALDEGKEDPVILEHLKATVPEEIRAGWRRQIDGWPIPMLAGMIGQGQHQGRLTRLLEAFKAGK
jgi:hypothetical protein